MRIDDADEAAVNGWEPWHISLRTRLLQQVTALIQSSKSEAFLAAARGEGRQLAWDGRPESYDLVFACGCPNKANWLADPEPNETLVFDPHAPSVTKSSPCQCRQAKPARFTTTKNHLQGA